MRRDVHSLVKVKPVRTEALHPGFEMEFRATLAPGFRNQPVKQRAAKACRPVSLTRHQVVHMENAAPREELRDPESGNRTRNPLLGAVILS